jgi:hypothetical protein
MRGPILALALILAAGCAPLGPRSNASPAMVKACGAMWGRVTIEMREPDLNTCLPRKPYVIRTTVIGGHEIKYYESADSNTVYQVADGEVSGWTD